MNSPHWLPDHTPAMRLEAVYGDRTVRCFVERPQSMHALLERAVAAHCHSDAVVYGAQRWSYGYLDSEVTRIAAGLTEQGVAAGERVVLFMGNQPAFVAVLFALQRIGAIAVPIGEREQKPGLTYMLMQCSACAIVFDAALAERLPDPEDVPALRLRITAAGAVTEALTLDALGPSGQTPAVTAKVKEQDIALILYTSGTTGRPKGAMLTHLNVAHSVRHYEACMGLRSSDRSVLAVPASHVTGLIAVIAAMVHVGGAIVILPEFKAGAFLQTMENECITHTLMVPAIYTLCLMHASFDTTKLTNWRIGGYGGAPMPVSVIDSLSERLPGLMLINAYGATETTSPTTMMPPGRTRGHADTVGVALPCVDVRVMDENGCELPTGERGELWISGPMVVPGYWCNAEATHAAFTGGYWHSGDIGSVDVQGYIRLFDRKKDMLNRGGFKIYSVEVENALVAMPGVVEAAIVGRPCPVLGERVHAFIYAPGVMHDDQAVRTHCQSLLTDYKVPESITWSNSPLPRNSGGKLLKRELREQIL